LISSIFIGLLFIVIGVEIYRGSKFQFATKILTRIQSLSYKKGLKIKSPLARSFAIGTFSIFLPCGFLYAAILALAVLKSPVVGVISTIAFWGGTLPAMMGAGFIIEKIFKPLSKRYPKIGAMSFIVIGLLTISIRVWGIYERSGAGVVGGSCH
jgi:sulfite exporter TauE/SafE